MKLNVQSRQAWWIWLAAAGITAVAHSLTFAYFPPIWQDEVQIIEYGRAILAPSEHDWSANWRLIGRPVLVPYYLGSAMQELAINLGGGSPLGPRLSALTGAFFASATLMGWLQRRGVASTVALGCSLLLLWEPMFASAYRGARLEGWVFGFIFAACWLACIAVDPRTRHGRVTLAAVMVGAGVGLAALFWISALFLIPLVLHELYAPHFSTPGHFNWRPIIRKGLCVMVGAMVVIAFALPPIWPVLRSSLLDAGTIVSGASGLSSVWEPVSVIMQNFVRNPGLLALGMISFIIPHGRFLGLCFLLAAIAVGSSSPYLHRTSYLLPYLLLGVALLTNMAISRTFASSGQRLLARLSLIAGLAILVWSATSTLLIGGYLRGPWLRREALAPARVMEVAEQAVGAKPARVYFPVPIYEFYYAGRLLGWKQFILHDGLQPSDHQRVIELMSTMDYAILRDGLSENEIHDQWLRQQGFTLVNRIEARREIGVARKSREPSVTNHRGYGEYLIYSRGEANQ